MFYVVALHGLPRAGKGTAAEVLIRNHNFRRFGFGDAVYAEVSRAFGVTVDELRSDKWKTEPQNLLSIRCADSPIYRALMESMGFDIREPRTSRFHLRHWATEFRRSRNPNYWVELLDRQQFGWRGHMVVDDLRFADTEYPYLKALAAKTQREFRVIEIVRPGFAHDASHVSDKHLPFSFIDHVIENIDGAPEVLQGEITNYLFPTGV